MSAHGHQNVKHQRRVEKECDPLHENDHDSSATEVSPTGQPAVCGRGGSHWEALQERIRRSRLAAHRGHRKARAIGAACLGLAE